MLEAIPKIERRHSDGRVITTPGCPIISEQIPLEEVVPASCLFADASKQVQGLTAPDFATQFLFSF